MAKLQIRNIRMYNKYWYAVHFTGEQDAFNAMVGHLKRYTRYSAYWREGEFDGSGGWIVRADILERHADRFDNFQQKLSEAQTQKGITRP
jgi:hypothetical protein